MVEEIKFDILDTLKLGAIIFENPAQLFIDAIAEIERLREIERAAILLVEFLDIRGPEVELPTSKHPLVRIIKGEY